MNAFSTTWNWRKLHCLSDFQRNAWNRLDTDWIDAGYCLDRYHLIDSEDRNED